MKKLITTVICAIVFFVVGCSKDELMPAPAAQSDFSQAKKNLSPEALQYLREVQMQKLKGIYYGDSCADSIVAQTEMSCQRNFGTGITSYQFTGSSSSCSFNIKMKDYNGGYIVAGDSIRITDCYYEICDVGYTVRTHAIPVVTLVGNQVTVDYSDCILPLNGTNGIVQVVFLQ